jgi:hypothetical protein
MCLLVLSRNDVPEKIAFSIEGCLLLHLGDFIWLQKNETKVASPNQHFELP